MTAEQAVLDLRLLQVGLLCLRPRVNDSTQLRHALLRRIAEAPELLGGAAVLLDLERLPSCDTALASELQNEARDAGLKPVGLVDGPRARELASQIGLPVLGTTETRARSRIEPAAAEPTGETAAPQTGADEAHRSRIVDGMVRSGQQIYAPGADLIVLGSVSAGAELVADGHIHIYGSLRGRALAGARGAVEARIFCRDFRAELVAIAGHYRLFDDQDRRLHGEAVQCRLDGDSLRVETLGC